MAENDTTEGTKKRIEIGDLPQAEKELTAEEAKTVKGGASAGVGTGQDHDALTAFKVDPITVKTGLK